MKTKPKGTKPTPEMLQDFYLHDLSRQEQRVYPHMRNRPSSKDNIWRELGIAPHNVDAIRSRIRKKARERGIDPAFLEAAA